MKFSKLKAPNTFLLIFLFVLVTAVLTWIIPFEIIFLIIGLLLLIPPNLLGWR